MMCWRDGGRLHGDTYNVDDKMSLSRAGPFCFWLNHLFFVFRFVGNELGSSPQSDPRFLVCKDMHYKTMANNSVLVEQGKVGFLSLTNEQGKLQVPKEDWNSGRENHISTEMHSQKNYPILVYNHQFIQTSALSWGFVNVSLISHPITVPNCCDQSYQKRRYETQVV
jgi:hypothetical protein